MSFARTIALAVTAVLLAACATPYQSMGLTGGYREKQLSNGNWQVHYLGNGLTTPETVQAMWLYRCSSLTLEKGFQGFEVVTPVVFSELRLRRLDRSLSLLHRTSDFSAAISASIPDAIGQAVGNAAAARAPSFQAEIRLLHAPFTPVPGKLFDAAQLKALLGPMVTDPKCQGNVCPHSHAYLGVPNSSADAPAEAQPPLDPVTSTQ